MVDYRVGGAFALVDQAATADAQLGGIVALVDSAPPSDAKIGGVYLLVDMEVSFWIDPIGNPLPLEPFQAIGISAPSAGHDEGT